MGKDKTIWTVYTQGNFEYGTMFNVPTIEEDEYLRDKMIKEIIDKLKEDENSQT